MKNFNSVLVAVLFILVCFNIYSMKEHQKEYQELKKELSQVVTQEEAKEMVNLMQKMTIIIGNNKEYIMENRVEINQNINDMSGNLELISANIKMINTISDILTK